MLYSSRPDDQAKPSRPCISDVVELVAGVAGIVEFNSRPTFIVVLEIVSSE